MTNKSTPIKKDLLSNDKTSNNQSTTTNVLNPESNPPPTNLINPNENYQNRNTQNFTFKIIKRRAPWNKKEDEAIIELVNKYGTSNWTIIANEMALLNKSKHRNGKQCRERWHNHLDPIVNKDNWTEEEENILFNKHLEYGNKWSDISKYLPGRTDNSIKNHFYSKLRKFIRKILKQINKENLLKNNGIDYYKYNSDKVYKLLKKYKITYKNVTKDTILDLIISTEKNQKGKIFDLNDDNKKVNNNNININGKNSLISNLSFNLDNNLINNNNEKININNNNGNKIITNKPIFNKKSKIKSKTKNHDKNNSNDSILKRDKKIFQSNIVMNELKPIKDNSIENKNKNDTQTNNEAPNKTTRKYKKKNLLIINGDKNFTNNENDINGNNLANDNSINKSKKKLSINPDYVQETYKLKNKSKLKIKDKEKINNSTNKKLLNKKRRRKKKRKVTISLSTPENKKTQINRIMPGRKFIFGLGQKLPISNRLKKSKNKLEINREDFDPLINEVEIVRDGLEIHSKSIILINKNLLTENLFPDMNYQFKPNLNISIPPPLSPKMQQFPSGNLRTMRNGDENNYISNFNEKNISIGLPTPMAGFYEAPISPINNLFFPPPSTKGVYNVDFGNDNYFLRKNIYNPILTPNTPKREINLQNKIVIQNNNNIAWEENNGNNIHENINKPAELNLDIINNNDNNNAYPAFPFLTDNMGSSVAKNITTPANIFKLSPTSPFIPRTSFVDKNL